MIVFGLYLSENLVSIASIFVTNVFGQKASDDVLTADAWLIRWVLAVLTLAVSSSIEAVGGLESGCCAQTILLWAVVDKVGAAGQDGDGRSFLEPVLESFGSSTL